MNVSFVKTLVFKKGIKKNALSNVIFFQKFNG